MVRNNHRLIKVILIFIIAFFFVSSLLSQEKRFIAILPFANDGTIESKWVARGIEEILYDKLGNLRSIVVFEKETLDRILNNYGVQSANDIDIRKAFRIGKDTGADVLVVGSYKVVGDEITFNFRAISTYTGANVFNKMFKGQLSDIFKLFENAIIEVTNILVIPLNDTDKQMLSLSATNSIQAFKNYCQAYIEFQNGANMETVASLFNSAIQRDPDFWEAQYNLGVIYFNFDKYNQALKQFDKVIERNASFYKPYYGTGVIYYLQRNNDLAIKNFNKVLELSPDHDRALYYLGRVYIRMDSLKKGLQYLDKSAEINPHYAPTYYQIALGNMKRGWYKTAVQALKSSIKLDPDNYRAHNALGECFYHLQRFDEAIYEYNRTTELRKDFSTAYFNLGNTIYKRGALEEIVDSYLEILETRYSKDSKGDTKSDLAISLRQLREGKNIGSMEVYKQMIDAYRNALKYESTFFEASFNLALTYENMGMADSAKHFYKVTIHNNPNLVRAYMKLGKSYEKEGNYKEALIQFKEVVKLEPTYFSLTPRLGEEYRYINIIDEVLYEYQTKLERNPNEPQTLLVLARIFSSIGRLGQAEQYYMQVVQRDPRNRQATQELESLRQQMKKL
jgi:tetratricopeptide (TPR) repeat protein